MAASRVDRYTTMVATASSTSAVWSLKSWPDCFINVGYVEHHHNHGPTASSMSAVRNIINTTVLHQCRSCSAYATVYNHCSTASSKSVVRSLQDNQPWLDRTVGHVELKSSTVLVLDHPHVMLDSVFYICNAIARLIHLCWRYTILFLVKERGC
jgi:hypothetical protein